MKLLRFMLLACLAIVLTGCHQHIDAKILSSGTIIVRAENGEYELNPSDQRHQKFIAWYQNNQDGWSKYYATNPNGGVFVSAGDLRLQFVGNSVFFLSNGQILTKHVQESDYAFLKAQTGT